MLSSVAVDNNQHINSIYLYGCSSRAANNLMRCGELDAATHVTQTFLEEMGLSGYFLIHTGHTMPAIRFGKTLTRSILSHAKEFCASANPDDKITLADGFILIRNDYVDLLVIRDEKLEANIGIIQDLLPLYFDSLSVWLEDSKVKEELTENLQNILQESLSAGQMLIENYLKASSELMCDMATQFPTLGLESDQEELILNLLNASADRQINLIQHEIQQNSRLGDMLIAAVNALEDVAEKRNTAWDTGVDSIELF